MVFVVFSLTSFAFCFNVEQSSSVGGDPHHGFAASHYRRYLREAGDEDRSGFKLFWLTGAERIVFRIDAVVA